MNTKQELEQQLKIAQQKLSGEIPLEESETKEAIEIYIQELKQELANLNPTNKDNLKQTLGENTEKIEKQVGEYYFSLEPWQRGTLVISLIIVLIALIYWLTKEDKDKLAQKEARKEAQLEERLLKQLALFKRLKE